MDLSDQKVHAETMPDKQTDEVLMPENSYADQPLLDSCHIYPDRSDSKKSRQKRLEKKITGLM